MCNLLNFVKDISSPAAVVVVLVAAVVVVAVLAYHITQKQLDIASGVTHR
jgi:diacylglycerol kinase